MIAVMLIIVRYSQVFNEEARYKVIFRLIKQAFIALFSFSGSLATKFASLNKKTCMNIPIRIDLNFIRRNYYPFIVFNTMIKINEVKQ